MSQKYIKTRNKNAKSAAYGKYFAQAVYDTKFIETDELASYIQQQASVKKSDIGAVLDELGDALKHYFELGQKVRIKGLGIFKVGFSSIGVSKIEDCTAQTICERRVLFQPETERVVVGQEKKEDGSIKQKYVIAKHLIKDVVFEETHDNAMNVEENGNGNGNGDENGTTENGTTGNGTTENGGGENTGGNSGSGSGTITPGGNDNGGDGGDDNGGGDNGGGDDPSGGGDL